VRFFTHMRYSRPGDVAVCPPLGIWR
jgi:hypothetical protein